MTAVRTSWTLAVARRLFRTICGSIKMFLVMLFCFISATSAGPKVSISTENEIVNEIPREFLSVALDVETLFARWQQIFNWRRMIVLTKALSPAYLRFGGTDADRLIYHESEFSTLSSYIRNKTRILTNVQLDRLNEFASKCDLKLVFDLNVLLRSDDDKWNCSNAERLMAYSQRKKFHLNFELGNEPNHLNFHFNRSVSGKALAEDYVSLKRLLRTFPMYKKSLIIGPSVTQPNHVDSIKYLNEFFYYGGLSIVDAATFHHYYFSGLNATIDNFLDPTIFDKLSSEIILLKQLVRQYGSTDKHIWLGETSSASGGGAPGLSDSFVSTFIWMDKLGQSALHGVNCVIRQSLHQSDYALISNEGEPNPDYWLALLFKRVQFAKVVKTHVYVDEPKLKSFIRFYAHWEKNRYLLYGMNLLNETISVDFRIPSIDHIEAYFLTSPNLKSKSVYLNDHLLRFDGRSLPELRPIIIRKLPMPMKRFSVAFFVVTSNIHPSG